MTYQLIIEPMGQTVEVEQDQTILDACLRRGVWLPHACCHGLCGTCKVKVVQGEFEQGNASPFALMDFEREEGQALACCATLLDDAVIEADVDEDPDALYLPLEDHQAEVVRIEDLTPTVKGIWLRPDRPVSFQAGQYLNLHLPDVEGPRAFSLANAPGEELIELHVRKVLGGAATGWLHDALRTGDRLHLTAPMGRFFVRKSAALPVILVAGGSGLSSPKSMLADLLANGFAHDVWLFQGARDRSELYFASHFEQLARQHPRLHYVPVLSNLAEDDPWTGARGFAHEELKRRFSQDGGAHADFRGHQAYLCGPPPMIEACIATLMQGQLFERDIFTEKFITAADAAVSARRSPLFRAL
ncbi:2Fe-2S iron-sulfur cluster-binding protein [Rhodanobacter soli]